MDSIYRDKIESVIKNSQNLLSIFRTSIYPPTYTNGLKDIAKFFGIQVDHKTPFWDSKHYMEEELGIGKNCGTKR